MTFIPQAIADPASRTVLFVFHDEADFRKNWIDKIWTIEETFVNLSKEIEANARVKMGMKYEAKAPAA